MVYWNAADSRVVGYGLQCNPLRIDATPCNPLTRIATGCTKLYPEKWTWILQLPMFVDSETVVWTPKVPRIPIV